MPKYALVILGAGASYELIPFDSNQSRNIGSSHEDRRPPLTHHVFRDDVHTRAILAKYQGARNLAATIRIELSKGNELEPLLRSYRDSEGQPLASQFPEIPLYLRDLFTIISGYTDQPTNYQALAHTLFATENEFDRVAFLTLNYETLLDDVLFPFYLGHPLESIDSYTSDRCILIKLHGSVNWVRRLRHIMPMETKWMPLAVYLQIIRSLGSSGLSAALEEQIVWRDVGETPIEMGREDAYRGIREYLLYYPAISAPLGTYDPYFACPRSHIEALKSFLPECRNVLAIGTSARDGDLLEILQAHLASVTNFHVVDSGQQRTEEALARWRQHVSALQVCHSVDGNGFNHFVMEGGLARFVESSS